MLQVTCCHFHVHKPTLRGFPGSTVGIIIACILPLLLTHQSQRLMVCKYSEIYIGAGLNNVNMNKSSILCVIQKF